MEKYFDCKDKIWKTGEIKECRCKRFSGWINIKDRDCKICGLDLYKYKGDIDGK